MQADGSRHAWVPLFLAALVFLLTAPVFWRGLEMPDTKRKERGYENIHLYEAAYPVFHYGFARLREGELPLWNPRQWGGVPHQADPRTGLFQPLNLVFLLPNTGTALAAHAFLCLTLMGGGFLLFARGLGLGWFAAVIGGLAYAYSGASAAAISQPELANAMAWAPWLFLAIVIQNRRHGMLAAAGTGVLSALVALSGSPPAAAAILAAAWGHALARVFLPSRAFRPPIGARLRGLGFAAAIAAGVSAVQWLPTALWLRQLAEPGHALWQLRLAGDLPRGALDLLVHAISIPADQLPNIGYMGILPLIALPAAYFRRAARFDTAYFTAAGGVALTAATLGGAGLEATFPLEALYLPAAFCIAALAALGADRLLQTGRDPRSPLVWGPALLSIGMGALLFYAGASPIKGIVMLLSAALLPFLLVRTRWLAAVSGTAVALILFADLNMAAKNHFRHPYEDAPGCYLVHAGALQAAEEQALDGRVLPLGRALDTGLTPNLGMIAPLRAAGGAHLYLSRAQDAWFRAALGGEPEAWMPGPEAAPALLNSLSLRVLLLGPGSGRAPEQWTELEGLRFRPARTASGLDILVNDAALPRVHWTPGWIQAGTRDEAIALASDPALDGYALAVLSGSAAALDEAARILPPHPGEDAPAPEAFPAGARIVQESANEIVLAVSGAAPGVLVVHDTHAPGWKAEIGGAPAPLLEANGLFRAVLVPAGEHTVRLQYAPGSFLLGLAISIAALATAILSVPAAYLTAWRRSRRAKER